MPRSSSWRFQPPLQPPSTSRSRRGGRSTRARGQTVYDWSGKGNHGFLGATPQADANDPAWTRGIFGTSALSFAGDDFVTVKDSNSLEPQQLTVGAWVKAPTSPGLFRYILAKGSQDCVAASYGLFTSVSGGLQFYVYDGARALYSGLQGPEIWDGKWHHVAGTFDGTQVKLFVDGKRVGDGDGPGTIEYGAPTASLRSAATTTAAI